ncbi:hypothetical protein DIPPA_04736 [Diplonema papillatum]|nr:hypothetical protein DIPPA_04736 [Diplonema papillatum]
MVSMRTVLLSTTILWLPVAYETLLSKKQQGPRRQEDRMSSSSLGRLPSKLASIDTFVGQLNWTGETLSAPTALPGGAPTMDEISAKHLASLGVRVKPKEEWFLGVCAGTKSSGSWLREWIELQLLGGIDHVWIMNDNDAGTEDGTQAIIQFYERLGFVTIIPGPAPTQYPGCEMVNLQPGDRNKEPNCAPVKHCAAEVGDQVQWLIFADTDEFIYPHHGCSLSNFVRNTCDINRASVSLRWERFGSSGHSFQPAGLMTETFLSSGGDCGVHRQTCGRHPYKFCGECKHKKVMFNTGSCTTIDHMGWYHLLTNTSEWKRTIGHIWVNSPGKETLPFKSEKCYHVETAVDDTKCHKWATQQEPDSPKYSKDCCNAGIGYNHYGTKALQHYYRKMKRTSEDLRGWRVGLEQIDLGSVVSFSVLRFVRALRDRYKVLGLPIALDVSFLEVEYSTGDNGAVQKGTCFKENEHRYTAPRLHGTVVEVLKLAVVNGSTVAEECCKACLSAQGCKGWTASENTCSLFKPPRFAVHYRKRRNWPNIPGRYITAKRTRDIEFTSGLPIRDECHT